jgi:O-antigen/teichoic acid export membrane protein
MLWSKLVEVGGARLYTWLVSLVVLSITARYLGPHGQGTIVAAVAWASLFASFASLSLGHIAQHRVQQRRGEDWLPCLGGTLIVIAAGSSVIAWAVAAIAYIVSEGSIFNEIPSGILIVAFLLVPLLILEDYAANLLAAAGRLRSYSVGQFLARTAALALLLGLSWKSVLSVSGAIAVQAIGQILLVALCLAALFGSTVHRLRIDLYEAGALLRGAAQLHLNTVGSFLLAQTSVLTLNHFAAKQDVGWYQLAYQLVMALLIIPQAASLVFLSRIAEEGPDRFWPEQKRIMVQVMGLVAGCAILAFFLAPWIILYFAGPEFKPSIEIFRALLPVLTGLSLAQLMTAQWISRGLFIPTTLLTFGTAVVNVTANLVLVPFFGIRGAVWASLFCYGLLAVVVQLSFAGWCERHVGKCPRGRPGCSDTSSA